MSVEAAQDLFRHALMVAFWTSLPVLAAGLVVGVLVSLGQILTSIQDVAVGAVPRLLALGLALALSLPWIAAQLLQYTRALWSDFSRYAG
jgi:flagellar biosynthetic protein FliQ